MKVMYRILIILTVLIAGCSLPGNAPAAQPDEEELAFLLATAEMGLTLTAQPSPTFSFDFPTITPEVIEDSPLCAFVWSTREAPETTAHLQVAMQEAGYDKVHVTALAYGENCINAETNEVEYFAAMQTDLMLQVNVDNIEDTTSLGDWAEKCFRVALNVPADIYEGGGIGNVSMRFVSPMGDVAVGFMGSQMMGLLEQNYHGADLFAALTAP